MNSLTISQPLGPASSRFFKFCTKILVPSSRRHESTYRRTRSRLNVKPDASFLPTKTEVHDHIIFNPPPSMPNVNHTPSLFLPKNDIRRQTQQAKSQSSTSAPSTSIDQRMPPPVRKPYEKKYHLSEKDLEEMRELRRSDAVQWSVSKLASKFHCSPFFVSIATDGIAKDKQKQQKMITEIVKSRWGTRRRVAREDRALRKERWYRDE